MNQNGKDRIKTKYYVYFSCEKIHIEIIDSVLKASNYNSTDKRWYEKIDIHIYFIFNSYNQLKVY